MGTAPASLITRLGQLGETTPAETTLVAYFEQTYPHLAFANLASIAEATGVSSASVTRFVRRLGYADFREFTRLVQAEVAQNFDSPAERSRRLPDAPGDTPGALWAAAIGRAQRDLAATADGLDGATFETVAGLVADRSRPLYLMSVATGRALLTYFYLLSRYQRDDVHLLDGTDRLAHDLINVEPNAVLLATMFDRHPRSVQAALAHFHDSGRTTILITNRMSSPLRRYADHVLLVRADEPTTFKSRVSLLTLLEALVDAMAPADGDERQERLASMESLFDALGVYIHP